jgi:hypothetical protein
MSIDYIEKIRAARRTAKTIDGLTFTYRRPTRLEMSELMQGDITTRTILKRFVVDWDLTELDIIPGGTPEKVPFDSALFIEWVEDRPEVYNDLVSEITDSYKKFRESLDEELGKQKGG